MGGTVIWFTGLPCSGKTTIAKELAKILQKYLYDVEVLDGDTVRQSLTHDLGFSKEDRNENIKRVTFVAKLLAKHNVIVLASFVSPYAERRKQTRKDVEELGIPFVEVYVQCPVDICKQRDIKGMYKKALEGKIKNFTGVNDPYEDPVNPDIMLHTDTEDIVGCTLSVLMHLLKKGVIE